MLLSNKCIGTIAYLGGVPAVLEDFCWSWGQLVQLNSEQLCNPGEYVHYDRARASYHCYARNTLVDRMQGDWLLQLDTDHSFDPDIAVRLLHRMNTYNLDVIVGLYTYKKEPRVPVLFKKQNNGYSPIVKWDTNAQVYPCDSAGAGCLLVKRSVFDKIRLELKCGPFDIEHPYSEDHSFFRRCNKVGVQPWFDPRIECHHLDIRKTTIMDLDPNTLPLSDKEKVIGLTR